jgi:hypothetical protein
MDKINFFIGEREAGSFTLYDDKGLLTCTVMEEWVRRKAWSIACGEKRRYVLKKVLGMSITNRRELESSISSSLKLAGIAQLKSQIKAKLGLEIRIDETTEEEDEFSFEAPKCGRIDHAVYQLRRVYKFVYQDQRSFLQRLPDLWSDKSFSKVAEEWVDEIYGQPLPTDPDPTCKCKDPQRGYDGLVNLFLGKVGMLVEYQHKAEKLVFPALRYSIPARPIEDIFGTEISFDREVIPKYLLFMANEQRSKLTGRFSPYVKVPAKRQAVQIQQEVSSNLLYLLIGSSLGAIFALLFAKKSGRELRSDIRNTTQRGINAAAEYLNNPEAVGVVPESPTEHPDAAEIPRGHQESVEAGARAYLRERALSKEGGHVSAHEIDRA